MANSSGFDQLNSFKWIHMQPQSRKMMKFGAENVVQVSRPGGEMVPNRPQQYEHEMIQRSRPNRVTPLRNISAHKSTHDVASILGNA